MCESCGDEELCEDRTDVDNIEEKNFCNECERYKCDDCMGNGPDGPTWLSNPLVNQYPYAVDDLWFCVECVVKVLRKRVLAQKATGKYKRRKTFDV